MFINVSNHPTSKWSEPQVVAAKSLGGETRDIQFPNVATSATVEDIAKLADSIATEVKEGDTAMVQGEFSLTYAITRRLRNRGIRVVVACTERRVVETVKSDGSTEKTAQFVFAAFREVE